MNFSWKRFLEELRVLIILVIIAFTIKSTLVEIYVVPTGSMEDTILTGDMLIGNKFIYGMRTPIWIGIPYTRLGFNIPWYRLPAFKEIKSGDVTIFEFPRDPFQKYVKRCIGTAGDSIFINRGVILVNRDTMKFPEDGKYIKGNVYKREKNEKLYTNFNGNRDNIDSFVVPYKGMEINFDTIIDWQSIITLLVQDGNDVRLADRKFTTIDPNEISRMHGFLKYKILSYFYSNKIRLKQKEKAEKEAHFIKLMNENKKQKLYNPWQVPFANIDNNDIIDNLYINNVPVRELKKIKLKHDFYFFMGDNRDNSWDSRFWGFVPDYHVLGRPVFAFINIFNFDKLFSDQRKKFLRFRVVS